MELNTQPHREESNILPQSMGKKRKIKLNEKVSRTDFILQETIPYCCSIVSQTVLLL